MCNARSAPRAQLASASPVNQRHARCMRNSSTSLRSLVMPYRYPISRMRSRSSGSIEGRPVLAVAVSQLLPHKLKTDVLVDEPQQSAILTSLSSKLRTLDPQVSDLRHRHSLFEASSMAASRSFTLA